MPLRRSPAAVTALALLAGFTVWITWKAKSLEIGPGFHARPSLLLQHPAPDFTLASLAGPNVSLAGYRGKKVIVSFWASWCGPCKTEMPVLRSFYRQAKKAGGDFEILAISMDDTREAAEGAAKELNLPFPVLLDADNKVAGAYGVHAIPALFVVDGNGRVIHESTGLNTGLEPLLAQLVGVDYSVIVKGELGDRSH